MNIRTDPDKTTQLLDCIKEFRQNNKKSVNTTHTMTIEEYACLLPWLSFFYPKYTVEVDYITIKVIIPNDN